MFLRVENKVDHIPDIDLICTLGESSSRGKSSSIGQFGTGFIHALAVFAREGILEQCKICLGLNVYTPYIIDLSKRKDSAGNIRDIKKIGLKKQNGGTYDLNVSVGFGELEWDDKKMGLREIISNAFDGEQTYSGNDHTENHISVVNDNQCGAKKDTIRVYIPMDYEVSDYIANIEHYFLCMKRGYNPFMSVIPKVSDGPCKVYRKGVLAGEFQTSLFDYNVNIPITESRVIKSDQAMQYCGRAIMLDSREDLLEKFIRTILLTKDNKYWESTIGYWNISPDYFNSSDEAIASQRLDKALHNVMGNRILCSNSIESMMVSSKGFDTITPRNSDIYNMLARTTVKKAIDVLDDAEALGNTVSPPTDEVIATLDKIWNTFTSLNLTNGRSKPPVQCFNSAVNASGQTFGYCNLEYTKIYIHEDISHDNGNQLFSTMIEEVGHYVTRATDCTRDFQSFFINLSARLMRA